MEQRSCAQYCPGDMNCDTCSQLRAKGEAAARELSRSVNDAGVAIQPMAGVAAGNRIDDAERALRLANEVLEAHKGNCCDRS